jgi:hypothetical protein
MRVPDGRCRNCRRETFEIELETVKRNSTNLESERIPSSARRQLWWKKEGQEIIQTCCTDWWIMTVFDSLIEGGYTRAERTDDFNLNEEQLREIKARYERFERMIQKGSSDIWRYIASFLDPADAAHLAMASKALLEKLGHEPLRALTLPDYRHHRIRFLHHIDRHYPDHLLCIPCGVYHRRTNIGNEKLKPDFVNYPLFTCPLVFTSYLPRMRLTHTRELPYSFIQLATRYSIHSRYHGIDPTLLNRRWKDSTSGWSHQSRYMIH